MESLALLVAMILAVILLSGPLGILLTLAPIWKATLKIPALWYARRILISLLALIGIVMGFPVLLSGVALMASLMVIAGMMLNLVALTLEYQIGRTSRRETPGKPGASEL
jgi:hypothetical protein